MENQLPRFLSSADRELVKTCYAPFETLFDSKLANHSAERIFCAARDGLDIHAIPRSISYRLSYLLWNDNSSLVLAHEELNCQAFSFHQKSREQVKTEIAADLDNLKSSLRDENLALAFLDMSTCLSNAGVHEAKRLLADVYSNWLKGFADIFNEIKGIIYLQVTIMLLKEISVDNLYQLVVFPLY
jgi:hypothetical protein